MPVSSSLASVPDVATFAGASLAAERVLPVDELLGELFTRPGVPQAGLVRGQVVRCGGAAPLTVALAIAGAATRAGAWLAAVDVPTLGLDAAVELGIPLERLVAVETAGNWAEVMGAVADGFELVVTAPPSSVSAPMARKVHQRLRARGTVTLVLAGERAALPGELVDVEVCATSPVWEGLGDGHGYLRARRMTLSASGRRMPQQRSLDVLLPGPSGRLEAAGGEVIALGAAS